MKEIEWLTKIKTVLKQLTKLDYEKVLCCMYTSYANYEQMTYVYKCADVHTHTHTHTHTHNTLIHITCTSLVC